MALRDKLLPPSLHCEHPNPNIDFAHSPLYVNTEPRPWVALADGVRRAGVSAFGFGGTNFHVVLEEYIPHRLNGNGKRSIVVGDVPQDTAEASMKAKNPAGAGSAGSSLKAPLRGALLIGADTESALMERLRSVQKAAQTGFAPAPAAPAESDLRALERLAIDYVDAADLADKSSKAIKALATNQPTTWKALRAQGIFRGHGPVPKVAFLYTGQGSQYVNMLRELREAEPIVAETFAEADRVMTPLLGKPLSEFIFVDPGDGDAVAKAEEDLRQTAITQPAVMATDLALTRLLAAYGIRPDMTMGHSLGEYGALVASGALPFDDALEAVSARGREMTRVSFEDNGRMAAVFAPLAEIERIVKTVEGYVVIANINSNRQAVIGGASKAVEQAMEAFVKAGYTVMALPVSHAFHSSIVAAASEPLRRVLERLGLESPLLPVVANVDGEFYPMGPAVVPQMLDILARQIASPVQFVKGLHTLFDAGARVFVEVGPKKALQGFADDVLSEHGDVVALFTNHPKIGDLAAFNQALCGLYAAGLGRGSETTGARDSEIGVRGSQNKSQGMMVSSASPETRIPNLVPPASPEFRAQNPGSLGAPIDGDRVVALGRMFAEVLERGWQVYHGQSVPATVLPVAITGAALGLPGTEHIFDDANIGRILRGEQLIDVIPTRFRHAILDKHITRLVKSDNGGPTFESINSLSDVIKLAARGGACDLESEFGVSADRVASLDRSTRLAIGAGLDALRDAGIPLVMRYKTTSKGTRLPDRWGLPDALRDDTGVIFASVFPGYDSFAQEMSRYYTDRARHEQLTLLEGLCARIAETDGHTILGQELALRIDGLRAAIEKDPYVFDRRFMFRILSMGHSQFAEFIGARGPNTQVNAACASTTHAVTVAEDWIRAGRCRRVIIVAADDITTDNLVDWFGAGFLATGAAATDEVVEDAALPFDRRRHGMIIGMGAAALVVESAEAARERGIQPICEVLSAVTANSAFHGTRLDVQHISQVMEQLVAHAELRSGISREQAASQMVFVSHETYTPARGGSAAAEIHALRGVFGVAADQIVITNTKGFTGHAMGAGIEDVVAVKALETACVPPVANFKEVDPELGTLNLSKGGAYPVEYALRLGAGFGSQISMTLMRRVPAKSGIRPGPNALGYAYRIADVNAWNGWLGRITGYPAVDLEIVNRTLRVRDQRLSAPIAEAAHDSRPAPAPAPAPTFQTVAPKPVFDAGPAPKRSPSVEAEPSRVTPSAKPLAQSILAPASALTPAATAAAPAESTTQNDPVKERILALVAEKTGYPVDMLDLDLDLEADLGVDTVKQAEVFATVREVYGIARDENRKLRDYPTLAHVIRFVHDQRPDLAGAAPPPASSEVKEKPERAAATPIRAEAIGPIGGRLTEDSVGPRNDSVQPEPTPLASAADGSDPVKERILELAVEKTGYPIDMLDLDLDLEADLGVDTVKQAEMFAAIREIYSIPRDENRKLRDYPTLAHVIRFVHDQRPDLAGAASAPAASEVSAQAPSPFVTQPAGNLATEDSIREKILDIAAEKTGYPKDMLDLDLDLEADLGVDTVKQAEMFASVRAAFDIPREESLKLRDFPTLAHVIKFAHEKSRLAPAPIGPIEQMEPQRAETPAVVARPIPASLDAANRVPRRVPTPSLRLPLTLCKPTGVSLGSDCRVVMMPDHAGVGQALAEQLEATGVEVLKIDRAPDADALAICLQNWLAAGPVHGVYWLAALDNDGDLSQIDLAAWREALRVRVKLLYTAMRVLYEQVSAPGTFLVSATRLGGQHGYDEAGAVAPLGGAVVGFTKTYKRERTDALVKAVDFEPDRDARELAAILIDETLRDPGAVEVGYKAGLRWTVGLEERPAVDGQPGFTLDKGTVFLVTGAAGSIVSAITADLAAASGGTFYLLDLVPEPDPHNPDLERFVNDKDGLKRDLFARIQARGERATPALVEKELAALERAQAAQSAIDAVRAAGGTPHYFSVNLTDSHSVATIIDQVRERSGRIDVLLHAAGVERSHFLPDKDPREFDLVFDVKSDGWFNLLRAVGGMPLGATVAFSSIAGRFGNAGQTDYSSANDLLCKMTSSFRRTRPATRAIAIDWTAWGGIGMATRGSIPKMMELAGIDMLPPEAGVPLIRRELTAGGTRGEIVIGQRLGVLLNEWDVTGGLEVGADLVPAQGAPAPGPMIGKMAGMGLHSGLTIETTLDPAVQPFLHDHQIDGTPLLPGVMGIEAFAEAALSVLPGWHIEAVEDVNFLSPFKFYRSEPRTLTIEAAFHPAGDAVVADCRLIGRRSLPSQAEPQVTTHFTARVLLTRQPVEPRTRPALGAPGGPFIEAADIYRVYFHGPAYQVVERAWQEADQTFGEMAPGLPGHHHPSELPLVMAPRLIELCFQTAGLWEMGVQGRMGLPQRVNRVSVWRAPNVADGQLYAVVTPHPHEGSFDAEVVDRTGNRYVDLVGYRTVALPGAVNAEPFRVLQPVLA
ncbi:MAG TPA: SDR family NAD(P)-dependent oxidoreductase [Bryobacteraceae bacterium]|nr:SDR family NAD(P)-dependent oxidoreductase [Bryobacteraceae bacterium]